MSIHIMTSTNCDLRESDPCRGHGRSSGRGALATNPTDSMLVFSHRAFTPFWPALASSKKESVSGSLAACKMKGETAQNAAL